MPVFDYDYFVSSLNQIFDDLVLIYFDELSSSIAKCIK